MQYVYPAVIRFDEYQCVYQIKFPDLDKTETFGTDELYDALVIAAQHLNKKLISLEDDGKKIPHPTYIKEIKDEEIVTWVKADTDAYRLLRAKFLVP